MTAGVSWDAASYGANLAHHRVFDDTLLSSLSLRGDERVLDLGCGVGDLSRALAALVPDGAVTAVDADPDMVGRAGTDRPANLTVERVAAQDLAGRFAPGSFDVVVSVAVLHWVPEADQAAVAAGVHAILRPGGRFRADFGGEGQIAHARGLLDALVVRHGGRPAGWYFPSAQAYRDLLTQVGFTVGPQGWVRRLEQRRPFDEAGVRGWLASQVAIAYLPAVPGPHREEFLAAVESDVVPGLRRADGSYDQDYVRIDLSATA